MSCTSGEQISSVADSVVVGVGVWEKFTNWITFGKYDSDFNIKNDDALKRELIEKYCKYSGPDCGSGTGLNLQLVEHMSDLTAVTLGGVSTGYLKLGVADRSINIVSVSRVAKGLAGPTLPAKIASTFTNGAYKNRQLNKATNFFKYHGVDNRTGRKFSWLTNK